MHTTLLYRILHKQKPYLSGMLIELDYELFGGGMFIKFLSADDQKLCTILLTRQGVCQVHLMRSSMLEIIKDFMYFTLFNFCRRRHQHQL